MLVTYSYLNAEETSWSGGCTFSSHTQTNDRIRGGKWSWIVILTVRAALSVSLVNKSVGGSTLSLAAFVFLQQFCFWYLIKGVCSTKDCCLFIAHFVPLILTLWYLSWIFGTFLKKLITKCFLVSNRQWTKGKVAENKQSKIIWDKQHTNLTHSYLPT